MRWLILLLVLCIHGNAIENALVPNAKIQLVTPQLQEGGLVAFLGEFGARNLRGAVTYANKWANCHRFKASGEYLAQDLSYSGSSKRWVNQYSFGAEYQCLFSRTVFRDLYVTGTFAHSYHDGHGAHRIAGADAGQARVGTTLSPWKCAYLSAEVDYDYVRYHKVHSHREVVSGLGGTAKLLQYLGREFLLRADAEFHQPYYFYEGAFQWSREFTSCKLYTGLYMNYTQGREGLPNVLGGGVEISLSFGSRAAKCCRAEPSNQGRCDGKWMCDLPAWAMESVARVPVVLTVRDPIASAGGCTPPTSRSIPNQNFNPGDLTYSFDVSPYFSSSSPLTYSAVNLPGGSSINPTTGVISGPTGRSAFNVTVTATSSCGSTSQTFQINFPGG